MNETRQKAIALCRVSSDEQLKNNSLSRQEESVRNVAEKHNLEIVKIWSGSYSSKCGKNIYRKDLLEALDFCSRNKQIKYVIVDEPDRFMRSINEAGWFIVEFQKRGVEILFSDEKYNHKDSTGKIMLSMALGAGEASNEERARKTKAGHEKAIRDGRYPFPPKLGYMRGPKPGIAVIDPVIGPLFKAQLIGIADGLVSTTVALRDYNRSIELAGIKKAPLKMDKWRAACIDPYLCGVVEMHKVVDAYNPNGLHEKLITREQHERIVEAFNNKPKNQKGPNPAGNPLYPFNQMITHVGCPCTKSKYNVLVGVTVANNRGSKYDKYRCRGCYMSIPREEVQEKVKEVVSSMELTKSGQKAIQDSLSTVFDLEEGDFESKSLQLHSQRARVKERADKLFSQYLLEQPGPMKDRIKSEYEEAMDRIKGYDRDINELGDIDALRLDDFCGFAIGFIDNLAHNVLCLPPKEMRLCKQLLFPDGFFVDDNKNVYTQNICPIYRLKPIKKGSEEPSNSLMVRMKRL